MMTNRERARAWLQKGTWAWEADDVDALTELLNQVAIGERERCARVAEAYRREDNTMLVSAAEYIATRIRG